jgi:CubicO group peptidase (beta-lactamase class C family)
MPADLPGIANHVLKATKMNRRHFNAMSLAALSLALPQMSHAQQKPLSPIGYQIAEIVDGRLSTQHGGLVRAGVAADDNVLFQVASCSKTVAALAILTLMRDGRIDIDQPANLYLQRWKLPGPRSAITTIADLMSHTAGTTVHGFSGYGPDDSTPNLLEILSGAYPANSEPVETVRRLFRFFKYSGGGTTVLQMLIEDVTGKSFARYVAAEVLEPAGAARATYELMPKAPFANGHYENGEYVPGGFRRHPEQAAAGLWATATDLARIMQAIVLSLKGDSKAIIPVHLANRMVVPVSWRSGLGVFVNPGSVISHDGRNDGFDSVMAADLKTGRIRAAVANQNGLIESYANAVVPA